jgi:pantoate--beta-alanine ligase
MWIFKTVNEIQHFLSAAKVKGQIIGFAPTMGALHGGHLALIEESKKDTDVTVCSIFVNPTQFNDPADLEKYPRPIEADVEKLIEAGCDVLFLPSVEEIYPEGKDIKEPLQFAAHTDEMEGEFRPGHFAGMAQVVERFLRIINPDKIYMGQKDLQQCQIVGSMIEQRGLPVEMVTVATIREPSGLAMASRNTRLTETGRKNAVALSKALKRVVDLAKPGVKSEYLRQEGIKVFESFDVVDMEYFEVRERPDLLPFDEVQTGKEYAVLTAAKVGEARLLDNMLF